MSTASPIATGELAVAQRVQQLQSLIQSARLVAGGGVLSAPATGSTAAPASAATAGGYGALPQGSATDFASALQAASGTSATASATGASATGEAGGAYEALIQQAAARNGLDPAVLHGLIQQESGFDPSAASGAGAMGLTQLMPGTASSLGVANPLDPAESIEGGARYLGQLMGQFGGNTAEALAAYNAGPGAVEQYRGIPPYAETQSYVSNVLGYAEAFRQSHPQAATTGELP